MAISFGIAQRKDSLNGYPEVRSPSGGTVRYGDLTWDSVAVYQRVLNGEWRRWGSITSAGWMRGKK